MSEAKSTTAKAQPETVALFVSDLHLQASMPRTTEAFFRFLRTEATQTSCLYLLGDIFEYWAGDDDLQTPFNRSVCDALRTLSEAGVRLYWIAGNRDFLVGSTFAAEAGLTLLQEPQIIDIAGQNVLLVHGDAQCIDDTAYMSFRAQVRHPEWQQSFLTKPLAERKTLIEGMREGSRAAQQEKSMEIMDVNLPEIERLFSAYDVKQIIHGHTHRPGVHETAGGVRYVLPDWDCEGEVVRGGWLAMSSEGQIRSVTLQG
ncbi:MAG: UDP-2,3-diacylglucosamine diphosphatase [Oxalobacteraceae bacterium]